MLRRGHLVIGISLEAVVASVESLMDRYSDVPMSLADACLVHLAESKRNAHILTLDTDFRVYRIHGRRVIPLLLPDDR